MKHKTNNKIAKKRNVGKTKITTKTLKFKSFVQNCEKQPRF